MNTVSELLFGIQTELTHLHQNLPDTYIDRQYLIADLCLHINSVANDFLYIESTDNEGGDETN